MSNTITKSDINEVRLKFIKSSLFRQHETYDNFRAKHFPDVTLNSFKHWFQKPYYIHDSKLCKMESILGIPPTTVKQRLEDHFDISIKAMKLLVKTFRIEPTEKPIEN